MDRHLVELDRGWSVWRLTALRSAGLPIERLSVFAGPGYSADPATVRESRSAAFDAMLADDIFLSALSWQNPEAVDTWAAAYGAALSRRTSTDEWAPVRPPAGGRHPVRAAVLRQERHHRLLRAGGVGPARRGASLRLHRRRRDPAPHGVRRGLGGPVDRRSPGPPTALRDHLPVRLDPSCTVAGEVAVRPYRRAYALGPAEAAVVAA